MKQLILCLFNILLLCSCLENGKNHEKSAVPSPVENGLEDKTYGVVRLSVCNMRDTNSFSSEMVSQALLGTPVKLFKFDKWYKIQTPDEYSGWVHNAAITPMDKDELNDWNKAKKIVVVSHYGFTYQEPDESSQCVTDVVAGNRLKFEGVRGNFYQISYPDGRKAYISKSIAKREDEWRAVISVDAESIIQTAMTLLGVPYLWAGTSSKGIDCSGFVRTVLFMHDLIMPRDASQQAEVGQRIDIAPDFSNLIAGDLVFFGKKAAGEQRERVIHVAIYMGNKRFIHSQGDVRINSFDPSAPEYDEFNLNRLLFATRILDEIGQIPEITTTMTNLYYIPRE